MTTEGNQDDDLLGDEQELRNIENNVSIETFMNGWFRYHLNEKK